MEYAGAIVTRVGVLIFLGVCLGLLTSEFSSPVVLTAKVLVLLLFMSMAIINIHRVFLLGPGSVPRWGLYWPGRRELRFSLYLFISLIILVPLSALKLVPGIGWLLSVIASGWVLGRICLVFPAVATDENWSMFTAWKASKGHSNLMLIVAGIFSVLIGLPELLISSVPYAEPISLLLSLVTMVITVAAVSAAYNVLVAGARSPVQASD